MPLMTSEGRRERSAVPSDGSTTGGKGLGRWIAAIVAVVVLAVTATIAVTVLSGRGQGNDGSRTTPGASSSSPVSTGDPLRDAIATTQTKLRTQPRNWLLWGDLGAAYVQEGRITADPTYYPKAEIALRRSLSLNPRNDRAMSSMAALAAARHDFAGALRWSRRATAINRASADGFAVMSDALNELGRYDAAGRALQQAVDFKPGLSTFTRVSYLRELHGDVPGAIAVMQRAKQDAFSPADVAFCDYYLGLLAFNTGDLSGARRYFEEGIRADSSYAPLFAGRAKVAAAQGRVDAAVADYTTAVTRFPSPSFLIEFGDYLRSVDRPADARQQYAVVALENRLLRANGVNQDLEVTVFQAEHGNPTAAVAAGRAEWDRRHSIIVADALGWALHAIGNDRAALRYARFATHLGYRDALYYFHLGIIEKSLGQSAAARRHLGLALRINPHFSPVKSPIARQALASLGGAG